jgi:hypothetical protein
LSDPYEIENTLLRWATITGIYLIGLVVAMLAGLWMAGGAADARAPTVQPAPGVESVEVSDGTSVVIWLMEDGSDD